jgi:phosphopantothenoylcysteine synthetase/decarboxylase
VSGERVLYLMVCGAGAAQRIETMVRLAQDDDWSVYCIATSSAIEHFLDLEALASLTGHPVRTGHQGDDQPPLPKAEAVIVTPATYNTINKWAAGIADTYVTTQLAELTGLGVWIVVLPFVNQALAANPVFRRSVDDLRASGVRVLFGPGEFEPHPPRTGNDALDRYPWKLALEAARLPGGSPSCESAVPPY